MIAAPIKGAPLDVLSTEPAPAPPRPWACPRGHVLGYVLAGRLYVYRHAQPAGQPLDLSPQVVVHVATRRSRGTTYCDASGCTGEMPWWPHAERTDRGDHIDGGD